MKSCRRIANTEPRYETAAALRDISLKDLLVIGKDRGSWIVLLLTPLADHHGGLLRAGAGVRAVSSSRSCW